MDKDPPAPRLLSAEEAEGPRPPAPDPRDGRMSGPSRECGSRGGRGAGRPRPAAAPGARGAGEPRARLRGGGGLGGRAPAGSESRLLLRHLSWKRAWIPRPPAPVNAPCPRSLCWRRAPSQERGRFQTKPASRRREWCPRKPRSSRRPGPRDAAGPRPECTQPRRSAPGGQQGPGPEEPESSAGPLPRAGGLPPVTLQVRAPSTDAEVPSPTLASPTFSSALPRSSPRTTSFHMSPGETAPSPL